MLSLLFEVEFGVNFGLNDRLRPDELRRYLNFCFGLVLVSLCPVFRLDRVKGLVGRNCVLDGF